MNKLIFKKILVLVILLSSTFGIYAQNEGVFTNKTEISIEIDPITFAFKGYGIHLRVKPKNSDHLILGIGTYAMDFPDVLVDFDKENKNKGWDVRLNQGYGLFGEYHITEANKKWFVGGQLALQEYKIEKAELEGNSKYSNLLMMAYIGYTWEVFDSGFYIKPWAGFGYSTKVAGDNELRSQEFNIVPITMFATVHLGYTF